MVVGINHRIGSLDGPFIQLAHLVNKLFGTVLIMVLLLILNTYLHEICIL